MEVSIGGLIPLICAGARCTRWWCRPVTGTGGQTSRSYSHSAPGTQVTWSPFHLSSQHLPFQITHSSNLGASLVSNRIDISLHIPEKMRRNQLNIFSDFHSSGSKAECGWWWSLLLLPCTLAWGMGGSKGRCAMGTGMF